MLTILGGTGLGLKDMRELLLPQIGKDSWVNVHFIDFAPFYTVDEVLPYFSPFVGGKDSITKNIRAILSHFYLGMLQLNFTSNYLIRLSFTPSLPLLYFSFASSLPLLRLSFASPSPLFRLFFASPLPLLYLFVCLLFSNFISILQHGGDGCQSYCDKCCSASMQFH
jgi:hypothetical protein